MLERPQVVRGLSVLKTHATTACTFFDIATSKSCPNIWRFSLWLQNVLARHNGVRFFNVWTAKNAPNRWCALCILTSKCALRHNGVHFFNISTSKKCSEREVACTFWLRKVLRPTTACTFSTSQLRKAARSCSCKCFAHFHFDLRFAPQQSAFFDLPYDQVAPEPQNIGKTRRFPTFLDFRATSSSGYWSSFCWPSFYWLFLFSACSHHRCCICPKLGSLTSKLPSVNM